MYFYFLVTQRLFAATHFYEEDSCIILESEESSADSSSNSPIKDSFSSAKDTRERIPSDHKLDASGGIESLTEDQKVMLNNIYALNCRASKIFDDEICFQFKDTISQQYAKEVIHYLDEDKNEYIDWMSAGIEFAVDDKTRNTMAEKIKTKFDGIGFAKVIQESQENQTHDDTAIRNFYLRNKKILTEVLNSKNQQKSNRNESIAKIITRSAYENDSKLQEVFIEALAPKLFEALTMEVMKHKFAGIAEHVLGLVKDEIWKELSKHLLSKIDTEEVQLALTKPASHCLAKTCTKRTSDNTESQSSIKKIKNE